MDVTHTGLGTEADKQTPSTTAAVVTLSPTIMEVENGHI